MAAPAQLVQFTFAAGIDQSQRHEVLDPASGFLLRQNLRQKDRGSVGRRDAFTYQTLARLDATSRSVGRRLFAHGTDGKQTCIVDGDTLDVYSTAAAVNVGRGRVMTAGIKVTPLPSPGGSSTASVHDVGYCNGYVAVAGLATGSTLSAVVSLLDAASGTVVRAPEAVTSNATVSQIVLGTYSTYLVLLVSLTGGTVRAFYLDTSSAATVNTGWAAFASPLITDQAVDDELGIQSFADHCAVLYQNNSGGAAQLTVKNFTIAGASATQTITAAPDALDLAGAASDTLWAAWSEGTAVKVIGLNPATLATTATTATVITTGSSVSRISVAVGVAANKAIVIADADALFRVKVQISAGAAAADGSVNTQYSASLAGRAFVQSGRYLMHVRPCANGTAQQETSYLTVVLVDCTDAIIHLRPVAMPVPPGLAPTTGFGKGASAVGSVSTTRYFAMAVTTSSVADALVLVTYDFAASTRWHPAPFGRGTYLSGGVVMHFDGVRAAEAAFLMTPIKPTSSTSGTGITLTTGRRGVVVFEEIDANGDWHQSGVSSPSASTGAVSNKTITWSTKSLSVSHRFNGATSYAVTSTQRVAFYATLDGGSPPYYRLGASRNDPTSATVTFADNISDATLAARTKLYAPSLPGINGGAQDRRAPPGLNHLVAYNGMLVGALGEDVWFSSQDVYGEGAWFNPIFQLPVSGDGEITGLASQDGTLYVFKRRAIYVLQGDAPSDNGAAGGFGTPRRLATDVGCIDARSLVVTEKGIFFQSERGIELLTRAQSVAFVGEMVKTSLGTSTVQAATLDSKAGRIYFETGSATALVYDLAREQWDSVDVRDVSAAQSACMIWDGSAYRYAYLQSDGYVRVSWDNGYDHSAAGNTWPVMRVTTGWPKLGGIQGQHIMNRVLLLAKKTTSAATNIALAYDYDETFETATAYTAATTDSLFASLARIQLGHDVHDDGEGQAMRVDLQDGAPGGTVDTVNGSLGHTWIALTFEGQPRENAAQLPQEAR